jgi:uncharacterized protein
MPITEPDLIKNYQLLPHPEGGYFKETYRSAEVIQEECLPLRYQGERLFSTAIYYLLGAGDFSAFHRIKSDETWHFYAGSALNIYVLHPGGGFELVTMGSMLDFGQVFQATIKAGHWKGFLFWDAPLHLVLILKILNWLRLMNWLLHFRIRRY